MSSFREFQALRRGELAPALAVAHLEETPSYAYDCSVDPAVAAAQADLGDRERRVRCTTSCPCALGPPRSTDVLVSVVCPTTPARHAYHDALLRCFRAQDWPRAELVVYDTDGAARSPTFFALDDARVRYYHEPRRVRLGAKRNFLVGAARGAVVAHFDDDNVYGPRFLSAMVPHALAGVDVASLSSFFVYRTANGALSRADFRPATGRAETFVHPRVLPARGGAADRRVPFPPVDRGEDGCAGRLVSHDVDDDAGLFLHVETGANTCPTDRRDRAATPADDLDPGTAALLAELAPLLARARRRRRRNPRGT